MEAIELGRLLARRDRPLVLEITEHIAIDDYAAVRSAIERLGADVRVAVDDAGAEIANFSHLVELRPHLVKVDAGLIRDVDTDVVRQAVVVGLVHYAAKAGCEVIAEGIETEAERSTAHALGVTHGQGYLIARPGRAGAFVAVPMSAAPRARRSTATRATFPADSTAISSPSPVVPVAPGLVSGEGWRLRRSVPMCEATRSERQRTSRSPGWMEGGDPTGSPPSTSGRGCWPGRCRGSHRGRP